jgi:chemotaxis-related protein WspB
MKDLLFLLFRLGNDRYALEASRVVEVLPLLDLKQWPQAPPGVAGSFNYRGRPVPAVDLCELALGRPARALLSTRIIIVNHPDARGALHLLGLIAERATEMLRKDSRDFVDAGFKIGAAPYLGPISMDAHGAIQWVDERRLLSEPVTDLLFSMPAQLTDAAH